MKFFLLLTLASLFTVPAFAERITGTVQLFKGRYVETGKPYSYVALATKQGKFELPAWIKGDSLLKAKALSVSFEAEKSTLFCTDMSSACLNYAFRDIKSVKIVFAQTITKDEVFTGRLARQTGRGVETPIRYNYVSIGERNIAVPAFFDANALLELDAEVSLKGKLEPVVCTDMSAACGPTPVSPLTEAEVRF